MFVKWKITLKVLPFIIVVVATKFLVHHFNAEFLSLSTLFTAIISANTFLLGFLISGVLVDYKESEKIPGEISASIEVIADECQIIYKNKNSEEAKNCLEHLKDFNNSLLGWFYKKVRTVEIYNKITQLNKYFLTFESLTQANFIARLKQEQSQIRKMVTRVHTVKETDFNIAAYTIVEVITFLLCVGLIFIKIEPFYESMFFVSFVSFILIYMILLIKDIDNPFDYKENSKNSGEVSLKPLQDLNERLEKLI